LFAADVPYNLVPAIDVSYINVAFLSPVILRSLAVLYAFYVVTPALN
jgi:hypothetical protein